ncbi:heat-inducible transcription repressor HrcA [Acholeplasma equirhinis]|uniref:heat-inducible transcriptional repressor HrcA n=1 Tax=Acholeplasma equirhinis TaxID=555393 RepID=UPI00197A7628|nr:heat-inducible transcriptional repressor HrcA [Acholeplasma equirhinis]MBN3490291.1 heat-inducible transcription repressor HrcA [Acholeplasma equirhinis]
MLTSRQKLILKAIIEIYQETAEPVGSKTLMNLPYLDFSSATLRYDMALLEELGYLEKTHTSSGRVPSDKGYRYYVDNLVTRDSEVAKVFPLVDEIFAKNTLARDKAVQEALNLLSEITKYTAVAVGPDSNEAKIKRIDFIPLSDSDAVILIVTDQGHVQHQQIHLSGNSSVSELKEVIKTLDDLLKDRLLNEAIEILKSEQATQELNAFMTYQAQIIDSFIQAFSKFASDSFYLSGMTNVFEQPEFNNVNHIKKFMDMMERREIVKLIGNEDGLSIRFSSDMEIIPMDQMTIVSVPYQISNEEKGTIALLGPSRMAYKKVIPLLEYIAANLAKLYKKDEE